MSDRNINLVSDARSVTSSLIKSKQSLHAIVQQADETSIRLLSDGRLLNESLIEHKVNLKSGLTNTKQGLNQVKTAEIREKRNLVLSIIFFTIVVFYIILKRTRILSLIFFTVKTAIWTKQALSNKTFPFIRLITAAPNISTIEINEQQSQVIQSDNISCTYLSQDVNESLIYCALQDNLSYVAELASDDDLCSSCSDTSTQPEVNHPIPSAKIKLMSTDDTDDASQSDELT